MIRLESAFNHQDHLAPPHALAMLQWDYKQSR